MMGWEQGNMFSSTAQILEAYLEASPLSSAAGSMGWTPRSATLKGARSEDVKPSNAPTYLDLASFATTPRTPLTDTSPTTSSASSQTAFSSVSSSPKKAGSLEIRRRRLPHGVEPRVKNLSLTRSNGATNPQPASKDDEELASGSDYNHSPPMESPAHLPPPPKRIERRPVPQKSTETKSVERSHRRQDSAPARDDSTLAHNVGNHSRSLTNDSSIRYQEQSIPKVNNLTTRLISLSKANPPMGKRPQPSHQKNLSISSNKALPPDPPVEKSYLPQSDIMKGMSLSPPPEERDMEFPPSQPRPQVPIERKGLPSGPKGLPMGPKLQNSTPVARRPVPMDTVNDTIPKQAVQDTSSRSATVKPAYQETLHHPTPKGITRPGPALGSLSAGPKPKPKHEASASLTSATVSGPVPLPDFAIHQRAASENNNNQYSLRTHSRNQSQSEPQATKEIITIGIETVPRSRPSQASLRSDSSTISRSTTPQSHRSGSTAATSISSLPDVPEVRSPLVAPELTQAHFNCYTNHRSLVPSANQQAPILCMTCKEHSNELMNCGWCQLRVCAGCKDALAEVGNDLKRMLDEAQAGSLVIGKRRLPTAQPFFYPGNEPRKQGSETMSIRSTGSAGTRPGPPRVQGPYLRQQRSMESLQPRGNPNPRGQYRPYGPPMQGPPMQGPPRRGPPPQQQQQFRGGPFPPQQMDFSMGPGQAGPMGSRPQGPGSYPNLQPGYQNMGQSYPPSFQQPYPYRQQGMQPRGYPRTGPPPRAGTRSRAGTGPQSYNNDDDGDFIPAVVDISLGAGEGPMAAGLRGFKTNNGSRPRAMETGMRGMNTGMGMGGRPTFDDLSGAGMMGAYPSMGNSKPRGGM